VVSTSLCIFVGLRTLLLGYRDLKKWHKLMEEEDPPEDDLICIGVVGIEVPFSISLSL